MTVTLYIFGAFSRNAQWLCDGPTDLRALLIGILTKVPTKKWIDWPRQLENFGDLRGDSLR